MYILPVLPVAKTFDSRLNSPRPERSSFSCSSLWYFQFVLTFYSKVKLWKNFMNHTCTYKFLATISNVVSFPPPAQRRYLWFPLVNIASTLSSTSLIEKSGTTFLSLLSHTGKDELSIQSISFNKFSFYSPLTTPSSSPEAKMFSSMTSREKIEQL